MGFYTDAAWRIQEISLTNERPKFQPWDEAKQPANDETRRILCKSVQGLEFSKFVFLEKTRRASTDNEILNKSVPWMKTLQDQP